MMQSANPKFNKNYDQLSIDNFFKIILVPIFTQDKIPSTSSKNFA